MLPNTLSTLEDDEPGVSPLTVRVGDEGLFSWDAGVNLITFDRELDQLQVDLTLTSTGTLSSWEIANIVFTPQTFNGETPTATFDGTSGTLTFPRPAHFFTPWTFQIVVNSQTTNGVLSPILYTSLPPDNTDSTSLDLTYDPADGSFTFDEGGFLLATSLFLVNTVLPLAIDVNVDNGPGFNADTPIFWSGGQPSWAQHGTVDGNKFQLCLTPDGAGAMAGFNLVLHDGIVQVASPDPILVNATLGDGG
jgi:hypothetical protein